MCNIQGTELNYPYLLYNERVHFSKILAFHRENDPFDEELVFFQRWQVMVALVCCVSLKKRLFWKSKMACIWMTIDINWNQQW